MAARAWVGRNALALVLLASTISGASAIERHCIEWFDAVYGYRPYAYGHWPTAYVFPRPCFVRGVGYIPGDGGYVPGELIGVDLTGMTYKCGPGSSPTPFAPEACTEYDDDVQPLEPVPPPALARPLRPMPLRRR